MKSILNHEDRDNSIRLNKFLSETGICSRREADRLIESGRVTVNGLRAEMGIKVSNKDKISVDGIPLQNDRTAVYIVLNKPRGIICTTDTRIKGNIIDFIKFKERIFPVGRLDKDSEGLIILTSDGDIVNKILRSGNKHEKEYVVTVDKPLTSYFKKNMENGVKILGVTTKPCKVKLLNKYTFNIILTQGLNRQIRRMCESLGYNVTKLVRIRIMNINLSNLQEGKWRYLTKDELINLESLIKSSVKTEEASLDEE